MTRSSTMLFVFVALLAAPSVARASDGILSGLIKPRAEGETPHFLPTFAAAVGYEWSRDVVDPIYGTLWLGVSYYPLSQVRSPFVSLGATLDMRTVKDGDGKAVAVIFGPEARAGVSVFPENNGYISLVNAYALFGWHAPSDADRGAFRIGLGVASPGMGIGFLSHGFPLPWMLEGVVDVTKEVTRFSGRIGISY